jgi:hypothetical protein
MKCICDDRYILSSNPSKCIQLIDGCIEYDTSDSLLCRTCREGFTLQQSECICDIEKYYDPMTEICFDFPQNCNNCSLSSGIVECISCYEGFSLQNSSCICNGEFYYDEDLNRCLPYLTLCEEYYIEGEELLCASCKMNAVEFEGECDCIEGYYIDTETSICRNCIAICSECKEEKAEPCYECNSVCVDEESPSDDSDQF